MTTINCNLRYLVYPGSEKLDIGPRKVVAAFEFESHAKEFAAKYGEFGEVVDALRAEGGESAPVPSGKEGRVE